MPASIKSRKGVNYSRYGYFFILPFFIVYATFQLYPLLYTMFYSTQQYFYSNLNYAFVGPDFVGLNNFKEALVNSSVAVVFKNTLVMWIWNFIPQMLLALVLAAWFTDNRIKLRAQGTFKVLIFMPNIITAASIAVLFTSLFTYPNAPINNMLVQSGIIEAPYEFFRSTGATRGIVSFVQCWMWYGNTMIILIAGIMGINPSLFESAQIDGCTSGQVFRKITLPSIKPILTFTLITSLIGGLQMFDVPKLLQNGNPNGTTETITMYIFRIAFESRDYGRSAAASMFLFAVTAVLSCIVFFMLRDKDEIAEKKMIKKMSRNSSKGGLL